METYKMIGGDGREYGPATLDELRGWIREGRLGKTTLVWREDLGNWLPAAQYSELEADLRQLYGALFAEPAFIRAGFWPRLGAYVVDALVLGIFFAVFWKVLAVTFGIPEPATQLIETPEDFLKFLNELAPFLFKQMAVYLPIHFAYDVILNGKFGATLGKMLVGLRIVRPDGTPISYGTAALRWLGARISDMICYIGYLFVVFREDKRALHDLIAGTQVILKR